MSNILTELQNLSSILRSKRPEYAQSLGRGLPAEQVRKILGPLEHPDVVALYSGLTGTPDDVEEESLFDLVPLYRLIVVHGVKPAAETVDEYMRGAGLPEWRGKLAPILANAHGDFICIELASGEGQIVTVSPEDPEPIVMYLNVPTMLHTITECYTHGAYFVDEYGLLSSDFDLEEEISAACNPGVEYWVPGDEDEEE